MQDYRWSPYTLRTNSLVERSELCSTPFELITLDLAAAATQLSSSPEKPLIRSQERTFNVAGVLSRACHGFIIWFELFTESGDHIGGCGPTESGSPDWSLQWWITRFVSRGALTLTRRNG